MVYDAFIKSVSSLFSIRSSLLSLIFMTAMVSTVLVLIYSLLAKNYYQRIKRHRTGHDQDRHQLRNYVNTDLLIFDSQIL